LFKLVGAPSEKFDDAWRDNIDELIRDEGDLVGRQEWDSGNPGAGAGVIDVVLFRGVFVAYDDVGAYGPYQNFAEAADAVGLLDRNEATVDVRVSAEYQSVRPKRKVDSKRRRSK
jgi:hypothetical protein